MISGRQIICLSSVPWRFLPTSRHHLARIFAEDNEVLFVDPPGNALRLGRDVPPASGRRLERTPWGGLYLEQERLHRLAPLRRLPYGGDLRFRLFTPLNQRAYAWSVARAARHLGFQRPVLWDVTMVYLAPLVAAAVKPSVHLVHMTDDLWSYPWYRSEYDDFLRQTMSTTDVAVGSTTEIAERLSGFGLEATVVGHGVDVDVFAPAARGELGCPAALADLPRPLVGFAGNIEARVDVDLVEALARQEGTVVLIGPESLAQEDRIRLEEAGARFVGPIDYADLPAHLGALDVGIIPYRSSELVRRSRPLKLLEMLAAGLPVVATDMPAARELAPAVRVATTRDEFLSAVTEESAAPAVGRAERVQIASAHSWRARAEELSALIELHRRTVPPT